MSESKKLTFSEWLSAVQSGVTGSSSIDFATIATPSENKRLHELFKVIKEAESAITERNDLRSVVASKQIFADQIEKELRRELNEVQQILKYRNEDILVLRATINGERARSAKLAEERDKAQELATKCAVLVDAWSERCVKNEARAAKLAEALQYAIDNAYDEPIWVKNHCSDALAEYEKGEY